MGAVKGRSKRAPGAAATLYARVGPEQYEKARTAAAAVGVSVAAYLDALLAHDDLDADGRPVWWTGPAPTNQEELPLSRSA